MPSAFDDYYEPFLGGGAMFFAIRDRVRGTCHLSDLNEELVNAWLMVQNRGRALLRALERYAGHDTEAAYYAIRDGAIPKAALDRAARFIFLNQTAWNSLWRVNRWGVFNVPWGDRPFRGMSADEMTAATASIRAASIQLSDFRTALNSAKAGDFVYLDPPYLPISDTSKFSGYTERRFRRCDLEELGALCRDLSARGVSWLLSNRDTPHVRSIFSFAEIVRFTARRSVANQNHRDVERRDSPEVLVIGAAV